MHGQQKLVRTRGEQRVVYALCLAAVVAALTSCKPPKRQESSLASVDTILQKDGQKFRGYACGPGPSVDPRLTAAGTTLTDHQARDYRVSVESPVSEGDVRRLLHAVPDFLIDTFVGPDGKPGKVKVYSGAAEHCRTTVEKQLDQVEFPGATDPDARKRMREALEGRLKDLNACWTAEKGDSLVLHFPNDLGIVNDALLPIFTYAFAERFVESKVDDAAKDLPESRRKELAAMLDGFNETRVALARAAIKDLSGKFDDVLERQQKNFGFGAEPTDEELFGFGNLVLAESVDSAYCSALSRNEFALPQHDKEGKAVDQAFKNTWDVFAARVDQTFGYWWWHI